MTLQTGDDLIITDASDAHWWAGRNRAGKQGFFPASFVTYDIKSVPTQAELADANRQAEAQRQLEIQQQMPQKVKIELDEKKLYRCLGLLNMAQPTSPADTLGEIQNLEQECDVMMPLIDAHIDAYETAEAELQSLNRRFEQALILHEQLKSQAPPPQMAPPQQYWQGAPPQHAMPQAPRPHAPHPQQSAPYTMPQQTQPYTQQHPAAYQHMPSPGQAPPTTGAYATPPTSQMHAPLQQQMQPQSAVPVSTPQAPPSATQSGLMDLLGGGNLNFNPNPAATLTLNAQQGVVPQQGGLPQQWQQPTMPVQVQQGALSGLAGLQMHQGIVVRVRAAALADTIRV